MGRHLAGAHIPITYIIAVIDDGLRTVDEVTRGLPLFLMRVIFNSFVLIVLLAGSTSVEVCQRSVGFT